MQLTPGPKSLAEDRVEQGPLPLQIQSPAAAVTWHQSQASFTRAAKQELSPSSPRLFLLFIAKGR